MGNLSKKLVPFSLHIFYQRNMKQNKQGLSNVGIANSAAKLEASEGNSKSTKKKKGGILTIKKGSNLPKENKLTNMMTTLPGGVENNDEEDEDYSIDNEDEEGLGEYKQGGYHKVTIGDKLNHRYTVTEKLGWGHFSTVWMCQDKKSTNPKFSNVALKIQKSAEQYREAALDEIDLFRHITTCLSKPEAARENKLFGFDSCVVQFLHHFDHIGPNGKHTCMVFEVLGENMLSVIKKYNYKGIPISIVKNVVRQVCLGLDFLHRHCLIIHTDIKPENILMESLRSTSSSSPGTIKNPRVQLIPSSNTGESAVDSNPKTFSSPAGIPLALDTIQSVIQPLEQLNLQRADGTEIDTNCASPNALTDIAAKQVTPPLDISFLTAAYALTLESDQSAKTILEHPNGTDEPSSVGQKSVIPLQNPTGQGQLTTAHRNHLRTIHKNEHDDDTSPIRRLNSRHDVHSLQDLFHRNLLSFLNFDIPSISGTYSSSALHSHIGSAEYQPSPFDSAALDEQVMMSSVSHLISPRMKPPVPLVYTEAVTSNITISESWVSDSKAHIPLVSILTYYIFSLIFTLIIYAYYLLLSFCRSPSVLN